VRELLRRIHHLFQRSRLERELADEMAFHREMAARALEGRGLHSDDAAASAQRAFGSGALAQDQARDVWMWRWLQDLSRDCRFAARLLAKERRFTIVAATVLGLGIGITNLQAVLVNDICIRGLPIPRVDRVVFFAARDAQQREQALSLREFDDMRSTLRGLSGVAAFSTAPIVIGDADRAPDRALGSYVSANAFDMLAERPLLGRDFEPADDRPGAPAVAILAHTLWASRYGGDPSIVGRAVRVNGAPAIVVGVMRDRFRFPTNTEIWQPLASMPGIEGGKRTTRALGVFGRLEDASALADVRGQLADSTRHMSHDYPDTNSGMRLTVVPINEKYNGRITDSVWLAFISVGVFVLLIACANTANLLLMRSAARGHEMALRASLGASRFQLVRLLLIESALLAALGGIMGTALATVGLHVLSSMVPPNTLPYWVTFTMDRRVFALLCAICLGPVFIFGFAPAIHLSKADVGQAMKEGRRGGGASLRVRRWTTGFLTAEFGLTMVMMAALLLSMRTARDAERRELVIDPTDLVTSAMTLSADRYGTPDGRLALYEQLETRLAHMPSLSAAAVASALPLGGAPARQVAIAAQPTAPAQVAPTARIVTISVGYFDVLSIPLLRGRAFSDRDGRPGYENVVVNQRFTQMFFPGADAIGRHIRLTDVGAHDTGAWLTIVGVSATVRQRALPDPDAVVYLPLRADPPTSARLIVRAPHAAANAAPLLRDAVRAIDPDLPLYRTMSMQQAVAESQWNGRVSATILDGIVLIAIALAGIGVYAVTSYGVVQRTQEIGIRMALGAARQHIVAIVLRRAAAQLAFGLLAGIACTLTWQRLFGEGESTTFSRTVSYRLADAANLALVSALLALITAVACVVPARRAARLDPTTALRHE
jgi:putative ABC transport system permease protein